MKTNLRKIISLLCYVGFAACLTMPADAARTGGSSFFTTGSKPVVSAF